MLVPTANHFTLVSDDQGAVNDNQPNIANEPNYSNNNTNVLPMNLGSVWKHFSVLAYYVKCLLPNKQFQMVSDVSTFLEKLVVAF